MQCRRHMILRGLLFAYPEQGVGLLLQAHGTTSKSWAASIRCGCQLHSHAMIELLGSSSHMVPRLGTSSCTWFGCSMAEQFRLGDRSIALNGAKHVRHAFTICFLLLCCE
jgi:hypothetical protein